ncbi:uncharacterized protein LOC121633511 isoform X2 [Melanotaenia boesemani]|uniref:uncharacterized protein LOC121633511 isoform X2 n=1 Tax=Melanotaenia boesemani TaxID=1250792 RepID=UPI001C046A94|nr:uncharacterized protein LOC121633511 isoform X2 [Melanotaenia boesemani]
MALLEFVLILLLHAEGVSGGRIDLYNKPGDEVVLPCNSKPSPSSCSNVNWIYTRDQERAAEEEVVEGNVNKNSARAARLSVNSNCSLIINNITDEDVGHYICGYWKSFDSDSYVFLNILTVSPSPPDADLQKDEVTLTCSLWRYSNINPCKQSSFRWLDDEGTELQDESVNFYFRQTNCVSSLTVKHQRDDNRRFTCQFVEGNSVKIEAHYTPDSTDSTEPASTDWSPLRGFMWTLRITGLILLIGITVVVIRGGSKKQLKDSKVSEAADEDAVTYENVGDLSAAPTLR